MASSYAKGKRSNDFKQIAKMTWFKSLLRRGTASSLSSFIGATRLEVFDRRREEIDPRKSTFQSGSVQRCRRRGEIVSRMA